MKVRERSKVYSRPLQLYILLKQTFPYSYERNPIRYFYKVQLFTGLGELLCIAYFTDLLIYLFYLLILLLFRAILDLPCGLNQRPFLLPYYVQLLNQ